MNAHVDNTRALSDLAHKVDELPLLPQVLVSLLQLDVDDDDYFEEFARLAREDPALAVRVVALANSAASCPVAPMVSIREALVRVGTDTVRSLTTSLAVQRVFMPTDPSQVRLWQHSITAAVTAEAVAARTPSLGIAPDHAYLAGLLHDIGRFVMLEHASAQLLAVDDHQWDTPEHLIDADYDVFEFTHSELGYLACKHWGLPRTISDAVRTHHGGKLDLIEAGSPDAMNYCVQVADRLSFLMLTGPEIDDDTDALTAKVATRCLAPVFEGGGADARELARQLPTINATRNKMLSELGFPL